MAMHENYQRWLSAAQCDLMRFLRHAWQLNQYRATAPFGPCATSFEAGNQLPIPSFLQTRTGDTIAQSLHTKMRFLSQATIMTFRSLFEKQMFIRLADDQTAFFCTVKWRLFSRTRRVGVQLARGLPANLPIPKVLATFASEPAPNRRD